MPAADAYVREQLEKHGIEEKVVTGKKGDVLIWHGQLLHGGLPINDHTLTRKSLVTHYWRKKDAMDNKVAQYTEGAYFLDRPHQEPWE